MSGMKIILYEWGVYLDTNVELFSEIPKEWCKWNSFWFYENELGINTGRGFGSIKKNECLEFLIEDYNSGNFLKRNGKLDMETCVSCNTKTLMKFFPQLEINDKFQIIDGNAFITTGMYNLFARHHYASSWIASPNYNVEKKPGQRNIFLKKFLRNSKRRE